MANASNPSTTQPVAELGMPIIRSRPWDGAQCLQKSGKWLHEGRCMSGRGDIEEMDGVSERVMEGGGR